MKPRAKRAIHVVDHCILVTRMPLSKVKIDVLSWMISPYRQEVDAMKKVIRIWEADRV